jgi:hypothetical protein
LKELNFGFVNPILDSFFIAKLAEDLPNVEKIVIRNLDVGRLNRTLEKDVGILLNSLKFFNNLKHFELVNDEPEPIHSNADADEEAQEDGQIGPNFRLSVTASGGQQFLEVSQYFIDNHAETIQRLKVDLMIVENE